MHDDIARAQLARKRSRFLTADQAAEYIGLKRRTLEKMRALGAVRPAASMVAACAITSTD